MAPWLGCVIDCGTGPWSRSQVLIAWGSGCTADRCQGCWCLVSDVWDLTDLHIPGRDPRFKTLLQNRDFYRHWDTDCSCFHVYINMDVVIKTDNKTQQGCVLYMAYAMTVWQHQLLRTMFFHSFLAFIFGSFKMLWHHSLFIWVLVGTNPTMLQHS